MRAKLIYEKFKDKSNPIEDMGIGVGALDVYKEVWTIIKYGDTEIDEVYINKTYAERAAEKRNKEYYNHSREVNKNMSDKEFDTYFNDKHAHFRKWEVKSLADAMDMIKDEIKDIFI